MGKDNYITLEQTCNLVELMVSEEKTRKLWQNIKKTIGKIAIVLIGAPAKDPRALDTLVGMDEDN